MDFKLDSNSWDIIWHNGPLLVSDTTQTPVEVTGQRIKILLQTWLGEWFINTAYGIPWEQQIIAKKNTSKASVDIILQKQVLADPGVKEIMSWDSTLENRAYSLTFSIKVVDGSVSQPLTIQI